MSVELSNYIEKRIVGLLFFATELKGEIPLDNVNFVLSNQITRIIKMIEEIYEKAKEARQEEELICLVSDIRKEVREIKYWLKILRESNNGRSHKTIDNLEDESEELIKIFSRIISMRN